jgi:P-type Ca2+ transporter type 2B
VITSILQVLIVEFGQIAFHVADDGLSLRYWGISIAIGAGSLPVQQVINLLYRAGQKYNGMRNKGRLAKDGALSTRHANGGHSHIE